MRNVAHNRPRRRAGNQTHYLIITKTYQRDDVRERERQRDNFQNCYIFVARRAGLRASHVALVVALVCGQSREFRVCRRVTRRVPNYARVERDKVQTLLCFAL